MKIVHIYSYCKIRNRFNNVNKIVLSEIRSQDDWRRESPGPPLTLKYSSSRREGERGREVCNVGIEGEGGGRKGGVGEEIMQSQSKYRLFFRTSLLLWCGGNCLTWLRL